MTEIFFVVTFVEIILCKISLVEIYSIQHDWIRKKQQNTRKFVHAMQCFIFRHALHRNFQIDH